MSLIEPRTLRLKTGEPCVLRSAVEKDAPALIAHAKALTRDPLNITAPDELETSVEERGAWIREHAERDGWLAIVAEVAGEVVGLLDIERGIRRRIAHQGTFAIGVAAPWRGRGVGDALLEAAVDWAVSHPGLEKLSLAVASANEAAIRLYEKHGFREEGRCPRRIKLDDGTYLDDVIMFRFVDGESPADPGPR